jgi:hypothetical protein
MDFNEKLAAARRLLATTGMGPSNYAPPLYRLLWRLGAQVPPPHFRGFAANALLMGGCFGVLMGLVATVDLLPMPALAGTGNRLAGSAVVALLCGAPFGLGMALYYRYGARRHAIPAWDDFHPSTD